MRRLGLYLFVLAVLIAVGSLYPFRFDWAAFEGAWLGSFLGTWHDPPSRGDAIGNILLFVPWGLAGLLPERRQPDKRSLAIVLFLSGTVLATALQLAQVAVPGRTPSLTDVWLNMAGLALGLGFWFGARRLPRWPIPAAVPAAGIGLTALWLAATAMPLVPSIDWQAWKNSLKPLLLHPEFAALDFAFDLAAWLAVGALLETARTARVMPLLVLAAGAVAAGLQVLAVGAAVSADEVLAVLAAAAIWWLWAGMGQSRHRAAASAALLGGWLLTALAPFTPSGRPVSFNWLPFGEYLRGSIAVNMANFMETVFVFATFCLLLRWNRIPLAVSAGLLSIAGLLSELAQVWLPGRTPGITNAILPLLVGLMLALLPERAEPRRRADRRARI